MTSAVLKWIANSLIGLVIAGTLWVAQAVQTDAPRPGLLLAAQTAEMPADAASAP